MLTDKNSSENINQIYQHLYGSKKTQKLAWEEVLYGNNSSKVKQISKQAKEGDKRRAYLDYQEVMNYLKYTNKDNHMYLASFTDVTLPNIYQDKINALTKYIWTHLSCAKIAKQCHMSTNQVKKLHNNTYLVHCYNLQQQPKNRIEAHKTRYQYQHQYQQSSNYVYYDYGLTGLNGDYTKFQDKIVCKDYQTKLQQLQQIDFIKHIIATQLEQPHTIHINGFDLSTYDNRNRLFTARNIRLLKENQSLTSSILAILACNGFISHRYGNKGRIIYYRNSQFRTLNSIHNSQVQVNKYDINTYGVENHDINIEREMNNNLKQLLKYRI